MVPIADIAPLGKDSRHYKLAQKVLKRLGTLLIQRGFPVVLHDNWPYHIGVEVNHVKHSLFCGGFDKRIDIQRLRSKSGPKGYEPDQRFKEVSFMTPEGAANYMQKLKYSTCTKTIGE
jgi:hypothetical protein